MAKRNSPSASRNSPRWIDAADRLRTIRLACLLFLDRWAANRISSDPASIQRLEADLGRAQSQLEDPHNRDWSLLYRGSVLDD